MTQQPLISCTNLHFSFGEEPILRDLSFDIPRGQHTILKGESGAGKTTLLKLFLGFEKPTRGTIRFFDDMDTPDIRSSSAWLPQDLDLGSGTVEELIRKPFTFRLNESNRPDREQCLSTFSQLGLADHTLGKSFQSLSTGQRQRVGIALCHLLDKPLLLLDEPTSALDSLSKQRITNLLLANTSKTVVSTSHDPFWLDHADYTVSLD
ncbi:ABC transporter ATP-binding protein [Fodinibius salsisoli]|uniref:ATP-binding cassette domain-containing protein n=1 Tax=Fodinibius salsisoli TaxID=2820877 RepID=A0ABT3PI62_9BACT|nr:ATP-binding cassette domain-containing protein [Fodinibius salsisoli]MCW9705619.1 ATP-binding cassette domain-containing protein [Fodinibius salsisoli]